MSGCRLACTRGFPACRAVAMTLCTCHPVVVSGYAPSNCQARSTCAAGSLQCCHCVDEPGFGDGRRSPGNQHGGWEIGRVGREGWGGWSLTGSPSPAIPQGRLIAVVLSVCSFCPALLSSCNIYHAFMDPKCLSRYTPVQTHTEPMLIFISINQYILLHVNTMCLHI